MGDVLDTALCLRDPSAISEPEMMEALTPVSLLVLPFSPYFGRSLRSAHRQHQGTIHPQKKEMIPGPETVAKDSGFVEFHHACNGLLSPVLTC